MSLQGHKVFLNHPVYVDICSYRGEWGKSDLATVFALYKAQIKSECKTEDVIGKII